MHTILVVDDFASIRQVVAETLQRHGFKTEQASDGQDALDKLKGGALQVDLILSDFNMPNMDGLGLLRAVKGDPKLKKHPFILLTSEQDTEKKRLAKEAGLDAWIQKPYKIESFIGMISYTINKK
ncbi:response regulator [Fulvivirga sediminis]|uniref:Response regulator n=1 Tax=Fulvivirga sediminis TaxID=2803949 RepID=A0A937F892_9BACT|nr:response regulator [Fulvivirga sediminis]MBL3655873.1 response regulator [Fulvivirga sediminis]